MRQFPVTVVRQVRMPNGDLKYTVKTFVNSYTSMRTGEYFDTEEEAQQCADSQRKFRPIYYSR